MSIHVPEVPEHMLGPIRTMCGLLDELPPSVTVFVPEREEGVVGMRTLEAKGHHPGEILELLLTDAVLRDRAAAIGIVAEGTAAPIVDPDADDLEIDLTAGWRVRTQVIVIRDVIWGKTLATDPTADLGPHPRVIEEAMGSTPLTDLARLVLQVAAAEVRSQP